MRLSKSAARNLYNQGHPVRLVSAVGHSFLGYQSCATGYSKSFEEFAQRSEEQHQRSVHSAHWERPSPSRQTGDEAAGHIYRREPFRIGNISGTEHFDPHGRYFFGDLPEAHREHFLKQYQDVGIDYVVWSYETVIGWVLASGEVIMPPVRYSNTTTQHQWLVARAFGVRFSTTESARKGKGKTPYTHREGW